MSKGALKQPDELSPGDVCDGYRIVALIAAGGMGDVYEAVHELTGDTVAFKCLKVRHRSKEDARARMKMEAVVLSELQHANLVKVFDAGVNESGMVWIAMERLHGQTLREVLHRAGPVSITDALYYASEIAEGVDAVHEVNVIHRDLKPENVFVTTRKVVKVLDLGTGKFTGYGLNSTDRMRVIGTTAYMSPEQIKGLRIDVRADVYALGLMTYEMIAGHHPLSPDGGIATLPRAVEQVALMQLQMVPRPLAELMPQCPRYISAILERAMAKNRDARYADMSAFARELRASRKRFIAENRLDDSPADAGVQDRGLRAKFGAPPRPSSRPPPPVVDPGMGNKNTVMGLDRGHPVDELCTEQQAFQEFTSGGLTPVPAEAGYEPTLQLSHSGSGDLPMPLDGARELATHGDAPPNAQNRTTHTSPLLRARAELTPEPISLPGINRAGFSSLLFHPLLRRGAATLGLGALIGVPPAVVGVVWSTHRRAPAHDAAEVATHVAAQATTSPVPEEPTPRESDVPVLPRGEQGSRAGASAAEPSPPGGEQGSRAEGSSAPPPLRTGEQGSRAEGSTAEPVASIGQVGGPETNGSRPSNHRAKAAKPREIAGHAVDSKPAPVPAASIASAAATIILPPSGL